MKQSVTADKYQDAGVPKSLRSKKFIRGFDIVEMTTCTIGAIALTLMAMVLGIGIITRYFVGKPMPGVYDIVQLLLVWVVFLSLSFTQKEERHIRVEIFLNRMSQRRRTYMDFTATLVGGIFFSIMSWEAAIMAWHSIVIGEYWPGLLRVPIYPSKMTLFFGVTILAIRFFLDARTHLHKIKGNVLSKDKQVGEL